MSDPRQTLRVYAALGAAMLIWGFSFLAIKDAVATVPVLSLLAVRFIIAVLLLGLIGGFRGRLHLAWRDLRTLAGLAVLSPIGYFLLETFGVKHTQPSHVAVIIAIIPTVVFLIAFLRRQERPSWRKGAGIAIAYAGVLLIIGSSLREPGSSLLGDLLILGAVLCAASRTVLLKDVLRRISPLQLTFYQFAFSLIVFVPLATTDDASWVGTLSTPVILEILFLGVFCSAGAFLAMHYALSHLAATQVAVSANAIPVITLVGEILFLGTTPSTLMLIGTLVTLGGVILSQLDRRGGRDVSLEVAKG